MIFFYWAIDRNLYSSQFLYSKFIFYLTDFFCSYDLTLEFSEAIFGVEKEIELSHLETCDACTGTGAKAGSKSRVCPTCGGRGQVMRTEQTPFGMFSQVRKWQTPYILCSNIFQLNVW